MNQQVSGKGLLIRFAALALALLAIWLYRSNRTYTCHLCHREQTGLSHVVKYNGRNIDLCDTCFTTQKNLGNITRY